MVYSQISLGFILILLTFENKVAQAPTRLSARAENITWLVGKRVLDRQYSLLSCKEGTPTQKQSTVSRTTTLRAYYVVLSRDPQWPGIPPYWWAWVSPGSAAARDCRNNSHPKISEVRFLTRSAFSKMVDFLRFLCDSAFLFWNWRTRDSEFCSDFWTDFWTDFISDFLTDFFTDFFLSLSSQVVLTRYPRSEWRHRAQHVRLWNGLCC